MSEHASNMNVARCVIGRSGAGQQGTNQRGDGAMADGIDREEFTQWMTLIRGDVQGIHARLDVLNGRTRQNETDIAILKDRGTRDNTARLAGIGSFVAGAGVFVWQWMTGQPKP